MNAIRSRSAIATASRGASNDAMRQRRAQTLNAHADRPIALLLRYLAHRAPSHAIILTSIIAAFACALASQYAIRNLIGTSNAGRSLCDTLSVVPQESALFHRSLLENLRYGKPDATLKDVRWAAASASCTAFIDPLSEGLDTIVSDRGVKLSGGQRQRIAIAREILKDSPVLILDEATSSLDSASEAAIQRALDRLMHGRTMLAIAHRASTLNDFDRIVVMQRSKVVDQGSPAELPSRCGPYREILERQSARVDPKHADSASRAGSIGKAEPNAERTS